MGTMAGSLSQCMDQEIKKIRIMGGGLAGLSLGIALQRRNVPVELHEALQYPRHRVCGEFISGVSEKTLEILGINTFFQNAPRPAEAAWWSGSKRIGTFLLPESAYAISRYDLDNRLSEYLQQLGGTVQTQSRAQPIAEEGTVWSAGRRPSQGQWIGLKAHIRGITLESGLEMHLGDGGYVGLVGIGDGWTNVCGLFRLQEQRKTKQQPLLIAYLQAIGLSSLADRLSHVEWREGSQSAVAGFRLGRQPRMPKVACIGDAHSIIPPFTGNGMSMALEAAALAVEPLVAYAYGQSSWSATLDMLHHRTDEKFERRLYLAGSCQRLLMASWFRRPMEILAENQLLPFRTLFTLTRN
jgi:2-polyprenyl-6-methoxyphenol hydroxylase-like FAD-dependent oxidoreductase